MANDRSKLDLTHIAQRTFDEASSATRVKMAEAEMSIELSAEDGDSVESHPTKLVASAMGCESNDNNTDVIPALDCSHLREVHLSVNGTGSAKILVSPTDSGGFFYEVGTNTSGVVKICARRIKIKSVNVVGDVHLVGRS